VARIGVLGTGRIVPQALVHPARQTPGITVAGVAARDVAKATAFASVHGIPRVYDSFEALLDSSEIDCVYMALPPVAHEQWAARALAAGKHVLCEKPLASNARAAAALVASATAAGRALHEAMHLRYLTRLHRQRELVASGRLGSLRHVTACFRLPRVRMTPGDHRLRADLGGGAALDVGCYAVSCARFIAGEEPSVESCTAKTIVPNVDRWMRARLAFPSGAAGTIECGFRGWYLPRLSVTVRCEHGSINWTRDGIVFEEDGRRVQEATVPDWTYQRQLAAFIRSVRGLPSEAVSPQDAVATLQVLDAMYLKAGLTLRGTPAKS
jgi:predicted dehydrogenase